MNFWIEVETVKPNAGDHVLVYPDSSGSVGIGLMIPQGSWIDAIYNETIRVTHWRPIPKPPKKK